MAEIHYLRFDDGPSQIKLRATTLHTNFHSEPPESLSQEEFEELYRKVGETERTDLRAILDGLSTTNPDEPRILDDPDIRDVEVGDIVRLDNDHFVLTADGWEEIELV